MSDPRTRRPRKASFFDAVLAAIPLPALLVSVPLLASGLEGVLRWS